MADAIVDFARVQPRLRVTLILEDVGFSRGYDFVERGLDLAVRISSLQNASCEEPLGTVEWLICASPAYPATRVGRQKPADLAEHACLVHVNVAANDRIWRVCRTEGRRDREGQRRVLLQQRDRAAQGRRARSRDRAGAALCGGGRSWSRGAPCRRMPRAVAQPRYECYRAQRRRRCTHVRGLPRAGARSRGGIQVPPRRSRPRGRGWGGVFVCASLTPLARSDSPSGGAVCGTVRAQPALPPICRLRSESAAARRCGGDRCAASRW